MGFFSNYWKRVVEFGKKLYRDAKYSICKFRVYFLPNDVYHKGDKSNVCSLCIEKFEDGESVKITKTCKHRFHRNCMVNQVFDYCTLSCPSCMENVFREQKID